ncbi:MAG: hypothetical protein WB816_15605 [Methylocystis sp.]
MKIGKIAFFVASAALLISGMSGQALARSIDDGGKSGISVLASVPGQASAPSQARSGEQLAFNPQPDPPGAYDRDGE